MTKNRMRRTNPFMPVPDHVVETLGVGRNGLGQIHVCRCFSSQGSEKCKYCMPV
jgi:hypothetical protein